MAAFILIVTTGLFYFYFKAICQRIMFRFIQKEIVGKATTELLIVDPDVDDTLWWQLMDIPPSVRVRLLTHRMTARFLLEAKVFAAQHGNWVEIRQTEKYHDRFIVLDGNTCWHLGASIKDAGKILVTLRPLRLASTLSQFERRELVTAVTADIENVWANSETVHM
jgi:ribosomal protein L31E